MNRQTHSLYTPKLYGRSNELTHLEGYILDSKHDHSKFLLLRGDPGIGKSTLIHYYVKNKLSSNFLCVTTNYMHYVPNLPFAAFVEICSNAFELLAKNSFTEFKLGLHEIKASFSDEEMDCFLNEFPRLRVYFNNAMDADVSCNEKIIDTINDVLIRVLSNVLLEAGKKLIIFLDDIQGMDAVSVAFFERWIINSFRKSIIWIGAAADGEVDDEFWAENTPKNLSIETIEIEPLLPSSLRELVLDRFPFKRNRIQLFSEILFQMSNGNPLEVNMLIEAFIHVGVLRQDPVDGLWNFSLDSIHKIDKSNKVLSYLNDKLNLLSDESLSILMAASTIGTEFNASILSFITNINGDELSTELEELEMALMLEKVDTGSSQNSYRFIHESIRSNVYDRLSEDKRKRYHYSLGKTYSSSLGYAARERNIFDIVDQFNQSKSFFSSEKDRLELLEMNLQAGKKAKLEDDFELAHHYFTLSIKLIESNRQVWTGDLVFNVYIESGEIAYLKNDYVSSVMFFESALKYANSKIEMAKVYYHFLIMQNAVNSFDEAWESGLKTLHFLDASIPSKISNKYSSWRMFYWRHLESKNKYFKIDTTKIIEDPIEELKLLTYMELFYAVKNKPSEVKNYLLQKSQDILFKKGYSPAVFFIYANRASYIYNNNNKKLDLGWDFCTYAEQLLNNSDANNRYKGRLKLAIYENFSHYKMHIKNAIPKLYQALKIGNSNGDHFTTSNASMAILITLLFEGDSIETLLETSESFYPAVQMVGNEDYLISMKSINLYCRIMKLGTNARKIEIEDHQQLVNNQHNQQVKFIWYLLLKYAKLIEGNKEVEFVTDIQFKSCNYESLSVLSIFALVGEMFELTGVTRDVIQDKIVIRRLEEIKKIILKRVDISSPNFTFPILLCTALISELKSDFSSAIYDYKAAVASAYKYNFKHFGGLINKRVAELYIMNNDLENAIDYLLEAQKNFHSYGASFKALQIEKEIEIISKA